MNALCVALNKNVCQMNKRICNKALVLKKSIVTSISLKVLGTSCDLKTISRSPFSSARTSYSTSAGIKQTNVNL